MMLVGTKIMEIIKIFKKTGSQMRCWTLDGISDLTQTLPAVCLK